MDAGHILDSPSDAVYLCPIIQAITIRVKVALRRGFNDVVSLTSKFSICLAILEVLRPCHPVLRFASLIHYLRTFVYPVR